MNDQNDRTDSSSKTDFIPKGCLRPASETWAALAAMDVYFGVDRDPPKPNVDVTAIGRFALARGWTQVDSRNPAIEIYERTSPDQQIQVPISGPIDDTIYMLAEVLLRLTKTEGLTLDDLKVALGINPTP